MANRNLSCAMLQGGPSVNLNHLKTGDFNGTYEQGFTDPHQIHTLRDPLPN